MDMTKKNIDSPHSIMASVLRQESQAILQAEQNLRNDDVVSIAQMFSQCDPDKDKLITIGIGKSGVIAQKIASTFTSLGLKSLFLHPSEALHGDLGLVGNNDIAIIISNSGNTEEILKLLPFLQIPKERRIALVGKVDSPIASACLAVMDCSVEKEACINNQAPTTSTTTALALGDAMAVLYEHLSGISKEHFAKFHPGGKLGKALSLQVEHIMLPIHECPLIKKEDTLLEVLFALSKQPIGMAIILNADGSLGGIVVEGDIKRAMIKDPNSLNSQIKDIYNTSPVTINADALAIEALEIMQKRNHPIGVVPVLKGTQCVGALRLHDLLKSGI